MKNIKKMVVGDCAKAVFPALIFNILYIVLTSALTVYTATIVSQFTDAVFRLDFSYGISNFWTLIFCLIISLFALPIFGLFEELLLFSRSLKHDLVLYSRFLSKTYSASKKFSEGEIQYRLEQDAIDFRCIWMDIVTKYVSVPLTLAYLLYNSLQINVLYTAIIFGISAIKFVVPVITRKINSKFDKETREYGSSVRAREIEIMGQPYKIKMFGLTEALINKLNEVYFAYFKDVFKKITVFSTIVGNISNTLDSFCTVLILLSGSLLIVTGKITAGGMVAAFAFCSVLNSVISDIASAINDTPVLKTLTDRLGMFYEEIEDESSKKHSVFRNDIQKVDVRDLSFSYEEKAVLSNVNFSIKKGEKIAICGQNGCGKSTLIGILCGFLKGYSGEIKIDGEELRDVPARNWYDSVAFVEQNPYLFSISVRENIRLGNLVSSEENVNRIIKELGIEALVDRNISMSNSELSGGEKQKIAIARALLKDTPIVFMDEPSNNLDRDTVVWLETLIKNSDKTIVYISHDRDLIDCADKIVSL